MQKNKVISILIIFIILSLNTCQSLDTIECEIKYPFYEFEQKFDIQDCVNLIQKNKNDAININIFHQDQEIPEQFEKEPVAIDNIKNLAEIIPQCPNLQKLEIVLNNPYFTLNYDDLYYFSNTFLNLENLKFLSLNFANHDLQLLEKGENLLEQYFNTDKLVNLTELHLNFYSNYVVSSYEKVFQKLTGLEILTFNFGGLKDLIGLKEDDYLNSDSFKNQKKLTTLHFEIPNINEREFKEVFEAINGIPTLVNLVINLSQDTVEHDFIALELPKLQSLYLNFDNISFLGDVLNNFDVILSKLDSLVDFKINVDLNLRDNLFEVIGKSLKNNKNLENFKNLEIYCQRYQSKEVYVHFYEPINEMIRLESLVFDIRYRNSYNCKNMQYFDEMLSQKPVLKTFILRETANTCDTSKEDELKQYQFFVKGINQIINVENIELTITTDPALLKIFQKNSQLKTMKVEVMNPIIADQPDIDQIFQKQHKLEVLDLKWNFLSNDSAYEYPNIFSGDKYYKSMQKLFESQGALKSLNLQFNSLGSTKDGGQFNLDFTDNMLNQLVTLNNLSFIITAEKSLLIDMKCLEDTFQNMKELINVDLKISNQNRLIELIDINFMSKAFDNCVKIIKMNVNFSYCNLVDFSPLETAFSKLKNLKSLVLNLRNNNDVNYYFVSDAFQKNLNLEELEIYLLFNKTNNNTYKYFEYAFLNNNKLKKLWIGLEKYYCEDRAVLNSVLQPLYNSVTNFKLYDQQSDLYEGLIDLTYLKTLKQRLFFEEFKVVLEKCGDDFNSPCQNCSEKKGQCKDCLYNFVGEDCSECKESSFEDKNIKQCISCELILNNCSSCNQDECLSCIEGYELQKVDGGNKCKIIEENDGDDNTGLIIGLSVGGVVLIAIIGISIFVIKKRKFQQKLKEDEKSLLE